MKQFLFHRCFFCFHNIFKNTLSVSRINFHTFAAEFIQILII